MQVFPPHCFIITALFTVGGKLMFHFTATDKFIYFLSGAKFHDFHHYNFTGNYASSFLWWDWLMGTDGQYRAYYKLQQEQKTKDE